MNITLFISGKKVRLCIKGDKSAFTSIYSFKNFYIEDKDIHVDYTVYLYVGESLDHTKNIIRRFPILDTQRSTLVSQNAISSECRISLEEDDCRLYSVVLCDYCKIYLPFKRKESFILSDAISACVAYRSIFDNRLLMHASVVSYRSKGYLFVGKSGRGKSTHSNMWIKHITGAKLLNDDNPIIDTEGSTPRVWGTPWSGKTPCYLNKSAPIGAIVQIRRGSTNRIRRASIAQSLAILLPCVVGDMIWDSSVHNKVISTLEKICTSIPIYELWCTPTKEAALICKETIVHE